MKPLAKRKEDNPDLTGNFQLLICGEEYVNAYDELNDPQDQRARWEEEAELASQGLRRASGD
jgi:lysyl-tRNA synthetase, class II